MSCDIHGGHACDTTGKWFLLHRCERHCCPPRVPHRAAGYLRKFLHSSQAFSSQVAVHPGEPRHLAWAFNSVDCAPPSTFLAWKIWFLSALSSIARTCFAALCAASEARKRVRARLRFCLSSPHRLPAHALHHPRRLLVWSVVAFRHSSVPCACSRLELLSYAPSCVSSPTRCGEEARSSHTLRDTTSHKLTHSRHASSV